MVGTLPMNVKHYCRKCGESFMSKLGHSAHARLRSHWASHGFKAAKSCHSNCSFKATFQETLDDCMYYGEGVIHEGSQERELTW